MINIIIAIVIIFIACKLDKIIEINISNYDYGLMIRASNLTVWILIGTIIELIILMNKFR